MEQICILKQKIYNYPDKKGLFRPASAYPEYIFKEDVSGENNPVYDMVRQGFEMLGLDKNNFGLKEWNPLGEMINSGDCVLIKPNMVLHENKSGCGTDCLFTNPSLVAAVIDYVIIALKGKGRIIVGDAPLQECVFGILCEESGYAQLIAYYQEKGIDISLVDFRNVKTYEKNGIHYLQGEEKHNGVIVRLDEKSAFSSMDSGYIQDLRITNYDPRILQKHHSLDRHEYNVSQYVLDADVIINMPKPKTHRKAGVTVSLKNLVGINANKEFLPHHTLGSKDEGGDAYLHKNILLKLANEILDIRNQLIHDQKMDLAEKTEELYREVYAQGKAQTGEEYWEGSWYGNDTIWRTIVDLNRILLYADKNGKMSDKIKRRLFIVGDMIVSGEKEGPLEPTPTYPGTIVMGSDPLKFDRAVCSLMGFDYRNIPSLYNEELFDPDYPISDKCDVRIISNNKNWDGKNLDEIREHYSFEFQPTLGWLPKLGSRYRENLYKKLLEKGKPVYVFGAGENGKYAVDELRKNKIKIEAFCDNNSQLWGKQIYDGLQCVELNSIRVENPVIIAVRDPYIKEISEQISHIGGEAAGTINRGM